MIRRLAAVFVVLASLLAAAPIGRAAASETQPRDVLHRVLSDRRFARARTVSWQAMLQRRVRDWLARVLSRVSPVLGGRRPVQVLAWMAAAAAILVLILRLLRLSLDRRAAPAVDTGPVLPPPTPGHVLAAEAAALIRAGRIREGARSAYAAAVRRLEEDGAIRRDPSRTPRETLRVLPIAHHRAVPMAALTAFFERVWYGGRAAGAGDGSHLLALLRDLECLPSDRAK
jgi:hypothetical protein